MSDELRHECGIAALYWLDKPAAKAHAAARMVRNGHVTVLIPPVLLDSENRGQVPDVMGSVECLVEQID